MFASRKKKFLAAFIIAICIIYMLYSVKYGRDYFGKKANTTAWSRSYFAQHILRNTIYSKFNITPSRVRKRVTILIIVSSGPRRHDRRQAIRETYWTQCKPTKDVIPECIFMTDQQNPGDKYYNITKFETETYNDMHFQKLEGGVQFGQRFMYHMVWASLRYDFDYFMRADDDYFFCMEKFLHELPVPMVKEFHWGWVHCEVSVTRPEESMIVLSNDIVQTFLRQDERSLMCHPWADQMIGVWSDRLNLTRLFRHDLRIHHTPIVSEKPSLREEKDICRKYMAIHGSYPDDTHLFWRNRGEKLSFDTSKNLIENSRICEITKRFTWKMFIHEWNYEPKFCINNPVWDTTKQFVLGGSYSGRQDVNKQHKNEATQMKGITVSILLTIFVLFNA